MAKILIDNTERTEQIKNKGNAGQYFTVNQSLHNSSVKERKNTTIMEAF